MSNLTLHDIDIATKTVWGEARGESEEGRLAVAHVLLNRWRSGKWFARATLAATCQRKWQFSCWNEGDPNRPKLEALTPGDNGYLGCMAAVVEALKGAGDPTGGATHYHTISVTPDWSRGKEPSTVIGHHKFYRNID